MGDMTVRNLPDEIHDELRVRATRNKRSVEAEVRAMITSSVVSAAGGGLGDRLRARFSEVTGNELTGLREEISEVTASSE